MSELAFHTNEELISELLSRATFAGFIARPKYPAEVAEKTETVEFDLSWSARLKISTVKELLHKALCKLDPIDEIN